MCLCCQVTLKIISVSQSVLIHTARMARILYIRQKVENFQAFESAIERYIGYRYGTISLAARLGIRYRIPNPQAKDTVPYP